MKRFIIFGVLSICMLASLTNPPVLDSANLTSVSNTLTSTTYLASRLSYGARVDSAGTTVGASNVQIQAAPAAPLNSTTTNPLHAGDTILINTNSYTIVDIVDADEFTVTPVVQAGDADNGDPIYLEIKPRHVVTFDTASAVADGFFQVLIPADTTGDNDGNIDDDGFDFGGGSIDVTASDIGNYDFITGVATDSGSAGCTAPANYHCFEVHYSGSGGIGTTITINIGNLNGTNSLISPGETSGHTEGTADTYSFIVKNFAAGADPTAATAIDQTTGKIAVIEAVRVSATVEPTISFTIAGVASAQTRCGVSTSVTTTALAVPFGSLSNLNTFYDAAQDLTVSTNAGGGYVVTSAEDDELSIGGLGSTVIVDTPGDGSNATEAAFDDWDDSTTNGFGYSLQNVDAASIAFEYTTTTGNCTGTTYCAKQFANIAGSDSPQTIFSSSTVANAENAYVCYRVTVGATQQAGDYENGVNYTATGTF